MNDLYRERAQANDEAAAQAHRVLLAYREASDAAFMRQQQVLLEERSRKTAALARSEMVRKLVRAALEPLLDPEQNGDLPPAEVLWATLRFSAGALATLTLDEPADLKVRRLGRDMQRTPIQF